MDKAENERLTRIGPGTPMGALMRRYWWPVGFTEQVMAKPQPVKLLGEDFILFRKPGGEIGFLERYCAHRRVSLEFGRVEEDGIRCCYHGWKYDCSGQCIDMPMEPEGSTLKNEVKLNGFAVTEKVGIVFAYIGPKPTPVIPPYDLLCRDSGLTVVRAEEEHCNWLQRTENTIDRYHLPVLHAPDYPQLAMKRTKVVWDETWYGIRTTELHDDRRPSVDHFMMPTSNRFARARVGHIPSHDLRIRVPIDDVETRTYVITNYPSINDQGRLKTEGLIPSPHGTYKRVEDGWWGLPSFEQDRAAQESQGLIADRSIEFLGTTDAGIVMFRRMLRDALRAVEEGRDPVGVVRDPKHPVIELDATIAEINALAG